MLQASYSSLEYSLMKLPKTIGGRKKGEDTAEDVDKMLLVCKAMLLENIAEHDKLKKAIDEKVYTIAKTPEAKKNLEALKEQTKSIFENIDSLHAIKYALSKGIWLGDTVRLTQDRGLENPPKEHLKVRQVKMITCQNGVVTVVVRTISGNAFEVYQTRLDYDIYLHIELAK